MNPRRLNLSCATLALTLLLATAAPAVTVVLPAAALEPEVFYTATHTLSSNVSRADPATIMLEIVRHSDTDYSLQTYNIMPGARQWWFATQYGAAMNESAMVDADYLANSETMELGPIAMPLNDIFYLGFRLDCDTYLPPYYIPSHFIYGWAALLWDGTELMLVGSAAETSGVGLYAGTYTPIPEPSMAGLLLAAVAVVLRRSRSHARGGDGVTS